MSFLEVILGKKILIPHVDIGGKIECPVDKDGHFQNAAT